MKHTKDQWVKRVITILMIGLILFNLIPTKRVIAEKISPDSLEVSLPNVDGVTPSGLPYTDISQTIKRFVAGCINTTAGLSVGIYDGNGVIYSDHFGYANREDSIKVDDDTVFEWGSVSKLFIWISAMQLVEQGDLDLEQDIRTYLPEHFLKNLQFKKSITMLDLMNHQGGFQEMSLGLQTPYETEIHSLEETLSKHQPKQVYEPGTVTAYSNWGAALAAFIIQRISGVDYVNYVHQHIFEPLGMNHTSIGATLTDNEWVKEQRKSLHCYDVNGKKIKGKEMFYITIYPAGSGTGTMEDFLNFARAITPNQSKSCPLFENQETLEFMYTASNYYGDTDVPGNYHGFFANQYGVETIGHGGNTFGCSSMLQFDPKSGVGMVVMTNQAQEQRYNYGLFEQIFGQFTDSGLSQIKRELPKGLISSARTIQQGPFSIMSLGLDRYTKEDLDTWWYQNGKTIYGSYGDHFITTGKTVVQLICLIFFGIAGLYGLVTLIIGGLLNSPILRRKRRSKKLVLHVPFQHWNYSVSALMAIIVVDFLIMMLRFLKGMTTWEMKFTLWYSIQSGVIFVCSLLLIYEVVRGFTHFIKKGQMDVRKEKISYVITTVLGAGTLITVVLFDMYQFWAL